MEFSGLTNEPYKERENLVRRTPNLTAARDEVRRLDALLAERAADPPSGSALDRAQQLYDRYKYHAPRALIEDIAKLIDRADAAAPAAPEVKPLRDYGQAAAALIESHDRVDLDSHRPPAVQLLEQKSAVRLLESAVAELEWALWQNDRSLEQAREFRRAQEQTAARLDEALGTIDRQQQTMRELEDGALSTASADALLAELARRVKP